jgi:hypothetical protein
VPHTRAVLGRGRAVAGAHEPRRREPWDLDWASEPRAGGSFTCNMRITHQVTSPCRPSMSGIWNAGSASDDGSGMPKSSVCDPRAAASPRERSPAHAMWVVPGAWWAIRRAETACGAARPRQEMPNLEDLSSSGTFACLELLW